MILTSKIYNKLNVLICGLNFKRFTGSELYMFDLAVGLKNINTNVTIASNIDNPLKKMAEDNGINVIQMSDLTGYEQFDVIHTQHTPVTKEIIEKFPITPKIMSIHSEIITLENPVIHPSILKYIAVRDSIKYKLINVDKIKKENIEIIYNPINTEVYNTNNISFGDFTLFVGTLDYLRKNTILDLIDYTFKSKSRLYIIGKNQSNYLEQIIQNKHVVYFDEMENVVDYVKTCKETASIMLGRTLIEGWLCNKPGFLYSVDSSGNIYNKDKVFPPHNTIIYDRNFVSQSIKEIYLNVLKK